MKPLVYPKHNEKYGDPKTYSGYCDLIYRVSKIDRQAAHFMCDVEKLVDFNYYYGLGGAFLWGATPQGHEYWSNIARKL